VRRTL